jgi:hypothetical protein
MKSAQRLTRWVTVGALVASLGMVPSFAPSLEATCFAAPTLHAVAKCCCGGHCRCLNCGSHRQPANDQQNIPTAPTPSRELCKVGVAGVHFDFLQAETGQNLSGSSHALAASSLRTLVAQHSCLRV